LRSFQQIESVEVGFLCYLCQELREERIEANTRTLTQWIKQENDTSNDALTTFADQASGDVKLTT
jgi:hypothetical protein